LFTTSLLQNIIDEGIDNIAFSMAQFATTQRATEGRTLVTTITGLVTAEPVSGS